MRGRGSPCWGRDWPAIYRLFARITAWALGIYYPIEIILSIISLVLGVFGLLALMLVQMGQ